MIRSVLILGGGSAGFLVALSLKARLPELPVRVVRSPDIGIIGVGEGSTSDLPNHLHGFLGLDPARFHAEVHPTYKLGVHFLWGPRPAFNYTFTFAVTGGVPGLPRRAGYYCFEDFKDIDVNSALMASGKAFARQPNGAPDLKGNVAYHMENADFTAYLERCARERGVEITDATVQHVEPGEAGVAALVLDTSERVTADLFVDASGFRSELLGRALGEPFLSYGDTLFCDRAVAGGWERSDEPLLSHTTAETMDAGWAWQIEHERHVNRGYVFSSAFLSDDAAEAEFRRKNPRVQRTRIVKFRTGRHERSWVGNVIALGNSAGFVEPLEATALLMICQTARMLALGLEDSGCEPQPTMRDSFNHLVAHLWDEIRDFLAVHYRFNTRFDTPFWQHCRRDTALHGAERIVQYYRENGPSAVFEAELLPPSASMFQLEGFYALLIGQKVPHRAVHSLTGAQLHAWETHRRNCAALAHAGCDQRESLDVIRGPHWRWTPAFYRV